MIESPVLLTAVVVAVTALAILLDYKIPAFSKIGASLLAIIFGALLSNLGLVAPSSPVYTAISGPVTSLAIVWLLLAVNLSDLKKAGRRMVGTFLLAIAGSALGAFVGALIFAEIFEANTWKLAGTLTGTYSGGSINFVAVGRGLGLSEELFTGATAADNAMTAIWLGTNLILPIWLVNFYPKTMSSNDDDLNAKSENPLFKPSALSTLDIALLMAIGFVLVAVADWVNLLVPSVPSVLWLTTLALIFGHIGPFVRSPGAMQLGTLALNFFFVIIGIYSRIDAILLVGMAVFFYTSIVVGIHGVVVYGVGRMLRMDIGTVTIASQAAVGGPSSAVAVAVFRGWNELILPGIAVGLLGYAIGNYLGYGLGHIVRSLGIGL